MSRYTGDVKSIEAHSSTQIQTTPRRPALEINETLRIGDFENQGVVKCASIKRGSLSTPLISAVFIHVAHALLENLSVVAERPWCLVAAERVQLGAVAVDEGLVLVFRRNIVSIVVVIPAEEIARQCHR